MSRGGHHRVTESRFRVMASHAHVILVDPVPDAAHVVRARLEELEHRWSRFIADSELSRLIANAGRELPVSADTITLLAAMSRANHETGGRYDPTMLHEILDAGYGVSIDDPGRLSVEIDLPVPGVGLDDVRIDTDRGTAQVPRGLGLDAGGIGKGLAADLVVAELLAGGTLGALVSVGGDLVAGGVPPSAEGWRVKIEDPFVTGSTLVEVLIDGGGVATSSTLSRRWSHRGSTAHHVLDPLTGIVSRTDLAAVTAMASTGWQAEAHATAALVCGTRGALAELVSGGCSGIVVPLDGSVEMTDDLARDPGPLVAA